MMAHTPRPRSPGSPPGFPVRLVVAGLLGGLFGLSLALAGCGQAPPSLLEDGTTPLVVLDLGRALPLARQGPAADGDPDLARSRGDTLYLPTGRSLEYFLPLPAGTVLAWEGLEARGETAGELRVRITPEDGEPGFVGSLRITGRDHPGSLELPMEGVPDRGGADAERRPWRLTLEAVAHSQPPPPSQGFLLHRPRLLAPQPTSKAPGPPLGPSAEDAPAGPLRAADARVDGPIHLVIYMIDTLRKDRLGCYGYHRPTSPALDAFAADAVLFEDAVAQSPWTRPSVASLFTGLGPLSHAVHGRKDTLAPEAVTLAEVLRDHGWATAGYVTNGNVARSFGFAQGFEEFRLLSGDDDADRVHDTAAAWLARRPPDRPFFLYLHTVDPHSPYLPKDPFRQHFAPTVPRDGTGARWWLKELKAGNVEATPEVLDHLRDLYDAEVAQNDHAFGRLLNLLEEEGLDDSTVVVVLSDHGEEFHEHGRWEHGKSLHTEVLDVPLVARFPEPSPRGARIPAPVQHTDLLPTLLAYFGLPIPLAVEGRDLTALLAGAPPPSPPEILSHLDLDGFRALGLTTQTWRFIDGRSRAHGLGEELFDRRHDPGEHHDLSAERPVTGGHLGVLLRTREKGLAPLLRAGEAQLDDELVRQLQALGYLP